MRTSGSNFQDKTLNLTWVIHLNWLSRIELRGPGPSWVVNIIGNYCCKGKILKKIERFETIVFFLSHFYHSWHFN